MNEHNEMVMDILKNHPASFCHDIYSMIEQNKINDELDLKLRALETQAPFNIVIPLFRENLGLTITTDEECIDVLNSYKKYLDEDDLTIINKIVGFVNGEELDEDIVPETDLLEMMEQIPEEKYPSVYNCIDYISEISEIS